MSHSSVANDHLTQDFVQGNNICLSRSLADRSLQFIQEKRQQLLDYARKLGSLYNSKLPISRLPNEILVEIFRHTQSYSSDRNEWLAVSWVSCHWRGVTLAARSLWANIRFNGNMAFLRVCLQRSEGIHITLEILKASFHVESFAKIINAHAARIQTVTLRSALQGETSLMVPFELSTMSTLGTLRVLNEAPTSMCHRKLPLLQSNAPCPQLHTLRLAHVGIHFRPDMYAGLLHLSLENVDLRRDHNDHNDFSPPLHRLLKALKFCPRLESLEVIADELQDVFRDPFYESELSSTASLPRLQRLLLHLSQSSLTELLSHMDLPSVVTFRLTFWPGECSKYLFDGYVPSDGVCRLFPATNVHAVKLSILQHLNAGRHPIIPHIDVEEDFEIMAIDNDTEEHLERLPHVFPSLTRLHLVADLVMVTVDCWQSLLENWPDLVSIQLEDSMQCGAPYDGIDDANDGFIHAFETLADSDICPRLEELVIVVNNTMFLDTILKLQSLVEHRTMLKRPLKRLAVIDLGDTDWDTDDDSLINVFKTLVDSFTYQ